MNIKLYKYMSAGHALEVLRTRMIKVTTALDANDPNEMLPNFVNPLGQSVINSDESRQVFKKFYLEKHAFVSLSEEWDNNVMWGVYGDKFRGIALVFDFDFTKDSGSFFPVCYSATRMLLREQECVEMSNTQRQDEVARRLFAQKDKQWAFEHEWRRSVVLRECTCKRLDNGEDGYFVNVDTILCLSGVILGPDCACGIGAVQSAVKGHETINGRDNQDGLICTCLTHDVSSYAVGIAYREKWQKDHWQIFDSFIM